MVTGEQLLRFPCDYPLKVVGRSTSVLRAEIDAIVRRHVPQLVDEQVSVRNSGHANYVSITYRIVAESREHITALVIELRNAPHVIMVI
ncbi:MAG: DUF493 domain-containing protein [Steroidobacteraceae bacterium]